MLFEHSRHMERLPSISELVLPTPMEICPRGPVRIKDDAQDCARILAGLHSPDAPSKADISPSIRKLPSISLLLNDVETLSQSDDIDRRGSYESVASRTPSLASSHSTASSPSMSPVLPSFRLPAKFANMTPAEMVSVESTGYGACLQHQDYYRRASSYVLGGRIARASAETPRDRRFSLPLMTAGQSAEKPRRAPPRSRGKPHNNIPYTEEQNHWVIYHKVDLGLSWREVEDRFNALFPLPPPYDRTDGGLQSTFYRWNDRMPIVTDDWLLVLDDRSRETYAGVGFRTHKVKVRASGKSGEACGNVTLIARYAEQVAERGYSWVLPPDVATAREVAARRRTQRKEFLERKTTMRAHV